MMNGIRESNMTGRILALIKVDIFKKKPWRLLWGVFHVAIICACIAAMHSSDHLLMQMLMGVVLGHSLGVLSFLGHEILHGSVVGRGALSKVFGALCFVHFGMLPGVWIRWHNNMHHRHTQNALKDPDCFGYVNGNYKYSRWYRALERFLPGAGTLRSYAFLFVGFSLQVTAIVFQRSDVLKVRSERLVAQFYFLAIYTTWIVSAYVSFGPLGIIFCVFYPLLIANLVMMSYIATNHLLSPLSEKKSNPLWDTLTVRSPRWVEDLHLQFGYHIEHHFFPGVSPSYARHIRQALLEIDPVMYTEMNHVNAIRYLYRTPRFYRDNISLVDPVRKHAMGTIHSGYFAEKVD
jgi:fatty acid desaturase